jgi:hypothetical protein
MSTIDRLFGIVQIRIEGCQVEISRDKDPNEMSKINE